MYPLKQLFISHIFFPLYHALKRDGLLSAIKLLEDSQWKKRDELIAFQKIKLEKLVLHCANNVPYYSRLFTDNKLAVNDLTDYSKFKNIPFITKEIINSHRQDILAIGTKLSQVIRSTTGGSTGESLVFYNDKPSLIQRQAVVYRNQKWLGALYSDKEVRLWGAQLDLDKLTSWRSKLHSILNSKIHLSTYDMSDKYMQTYVNIINSYHPKVLVSYPSPLAEFSKYIIDNNIKIHSIKSIITSAEKLYDWQRVLINKAFNSQIYDRYGCREFGNIAHECASHEGYHVNDERFFIEILDDYGEPVKNGQVGKIYITDLDNYAFPFVRYDIGDMAEASDCSCSCGRGLTLIKRIDGRSFDIIKCPNGNRVAGTFWTICLRRYTGVVKFQVVQTKSDELKIHLVVDDKYTITNEANMIIDIQKKCGSLMRVIFDYVDKIDLTKSGKEKLVMSLLSGD